MREALGPGGYRCFAQMGTSLELRLQGLRIGLRGGPPFGMMRGSPERSYGLYPSETILE